MFWRTILFLGLTAGCKLTESPGPTVANSNTLNCARSQQDHTLIVLGEGETWALNQMIEGQCVLGAQQTIGDANEATRCTWPSAVARLENRNWILCSATSKLIVQTESSVDEVVALPQRSLPSGLKLTENFIYITLAGTHQLLRVDRDSPLRQDLINFPQKTLANVTYMASPSAIVGAQGKLYIALAYRDLNFNPAPTGGLAIVDETTWSLEQVLETSFPNTSGIQVIDDWIYAISPGRYTGIKASGGGVDRFNQNGAKESLAIREMAPLSSASIAGDIILGDANSAGVWKLNEMELTKLSDLEQTLCSTPLEKSGYIGSIATTEDRIYIANYHGNCISVLDTNGSELNVFKNVTAPGAMATEEL